MLACLLVVWPVFCDKICWHFSPRAPLNATYIAHPRHDFQGSEDGHVHVYDIVEAKVTRLLKHHKRPVCSMSYHPSEPMLLTASYDGSTVLWAP